MMLLFVSQGPKGEGVGSITQPLPSSHLIFRAASESDGETQTHRRVLCVTAASVFINPVMCAGRCWMDALELALKCSSLLKRTMVREGREEMTQTAEHSHINFYSLLRAHNMQGFQ